jgi:hypothetical protein
MRDWTAVWKDPDVLYHGTSWENALRIQQHGLRWTPNVVSLDDGNLVLEFFDAIGWTGGCAGAWWTLREILRAFDFADGPTKPVFLAGRRVGTWRTSLPGHHTQVSDRAASGAGRDHRPSHPVRCTWESRRS